LAGARGRADRRALLDGGRRGDARLLRRRGLHGRTRLLRRGLGRAPLLEGRCGPLRGGLDGGCLALRGRLDGRAGLLLDRRDGRARLLHGGAALLLRRRRSAGTALARILALALRLHLREKERAVGAQGLSEAGTDRQDGQDGARQEGAFHRVHDRLQVVA
jgi:hypothetical protein